jgi:hypothetical protein
MGRPPVTVKELLDIGLRYCEIQAYIQEACDSELQRNASSPQLI